MSPQHPDLVQELASAAYAWGKAQASNLELLHPEAYREIEARYQAAVMALQAQQERTPRKPLPSPRRAVEER